MSLSRPVKFPLLKLPLLCIECVIKSWDIFDIIFFALSSKKTRQIVKNLKIPLNEIVVYLTECKEIMLDSSSKIWYFKKESEADSWYEERYQDFNEYSLVLQKNELPYKRADSSLESYTDGKEVICLKMAMEFLNELFKCSVKTVSIKVDDIPESGDIGVKSTVNLFIDHSYGYAQAQKLNLFLENLEVTDTCTFWMENFENGFSCDPKLFKCKTLVFWPDSAAWLTRDTLLQFEVAQLRIYHCPFSVEDILSIVTQWFHSDNMKLEYLLIYIQNTQVSRENFYTDDLNPVPFSERTRVPPSESDLMLFEGLDFSKGLEIVRHDGLEATIHLTRGLFVFYIWHNQ